MDSELKPCPFCNVHIDIIDGVAYHPASDAVDCPLNGLSAPVSEVRAAWCTPPADKPAQSGEVSDEGIAKAIRWSGVFWSPELVIAAAAGDKPSNIALSIMAHARAIDINRALTERLSVAEEEVARLRERFVSEREEKLWNAYHSGFVSAGRWGHMFMSDGEWLARECGFDPSDPDYDDMDIRAAIPVAVRAYLMENEHD